MNSKMKRIVISAAALILALTLCACNGGGNPGTTPTASNPEQTPASEPTQGQDGRGDLLDNEFYLTLYADFPGGTWEKNIDLPIEDEPASPSLIVFYLADELSAWTGLDFTLNDVSFGEDSVTVDWSADSTLIAGLDNREQKEDFHFFDAISLNWFMMDSLAMTLKMNFDVTTVYYCSDGGPVTFTNPENMAAQGLPVLPVDQPYDGSTFFINQAGGRGDLIDEGEYTPYGYKYSLRLNFRLDGDFRLDGLEWDSGNEYTLDGAVKVYSDVLGGGNNIGAQIEDYLRLQEREVSEWLSLEADEALSEMIGYPVWIAEYYVGYEEDTNICVDAVVLAGEFNDRDYVLILHTMRDADLDMNTDTDFGARIRELFTAIEVVTV